MQEQLSVCSRGAYGRWYLLVQLYLLGQEGGGQLAGKRAGFSTTAICEYATTLSTLHTQLRVMMVNTDAAQLSGACSRAVRQQPACDCQLARGPGPHQLGAELLSTAKSSFQMS